MFQNIMLKGIFKYLNHRRSFEEENDFTIMNDIFKFETTLGFFGKIAYTYPDNNKTEYRMQKNSLYKTQYFIDFC